MKKLIRRTIISTMIYMGINLIVWFTRPVHFVCFGIYTMTYYMSALLWLWMAHRDFKREVSVVCPEIYRDWDQLMWGDIFTPRQKAKGNLRIYPTGNAEESPQNEPYRRCRARNEPGSDRGRRDVPFYRCGSIHGFDAIWRENILIIHHRGRCPFRLRFFGQLVLATSRNKRNQLVKRPALIGR